MKKVKRLGSAILFVLGVLLLAHAVFNWVSGIRLQRVLRHQSERGLPMGLVQIMPPSVAAEDNAAPLLEQAFGILHALKPDALLVFEATEKNATPGSFPLDGLDMAQRARLADLLASPALAPAFEALAQAATKSGCDFALDYARGPALRLPHLAFMRKALRLLCLRAWLRADEGLAAESLQDILHAFRLCRHLQREPTTISQRVYMNGDAAIVRHLNAVLRKLPVKALPADTLREIEAEIDEHLNPAASAAHLALDGERIIFGKALFERALKGELSASDRAAIGLTRACPLCLGCIWQPVLKNDYRHYLVTMEQAREQISRPYYETEPDLETVAATPRCFLLSRLITPALDGFRREVAVHEACLRLARTGLRLCLKRQDTGTYPATLRDLGVSEVLTTDPFTGSSLLYRTSDQQGVVYSVGPDGRDDSGEPFDAAGRPADLVWRL